jgi:hypothetical protein
MLRQAAVQFGSPVAVEVVLTIALKVPPVFEPGVGVEIAARLLARITV